MRGLVRIFIAALLALFSANSVRGVDPNRTMSQYVVQRWDVGQELLGAQVYSIGQSADGYLVVATANGLLQFDGFTFAQMHSSDVGAMLNRVVEVVTDAQGTQWLRLSAAGSTLLRHENGAFRNAVADLPTLFAVDAIARGRDGTALCLLNYRVGSSVGGRSAASNIVPCSRMSDRSVPSRGFPQSTVLALAQTSDGDFWLGTTDEGLFRVHNGQAEAVNKGLPDLKVNALAPGTNGELWVATDAGLIRWDGTKLTRAGIPDSIRGVQVLAMLIDKDSNIWLGTNAHGLLRFNAHGVSALATPHVGTPPAITAIFEDREGDVWVAGGTGLMMLRDSPFISYSQPEGLPSPESSPVFVDAAGRTWFAPLRGGLMWFNGERQGQVLNDGISRDLVYSIDGRNGDLWIGRQHGGLTHLRHEGASLQSTTYTEKNGLAQNTVYSVYQARDGTVWAGTVSGGVSRIAEGRVTTYRAADGLISNSVNSIIEAADGAMWFATPGGLSEFSQGRWSSFTKSDGLPSDEVNCMLLDSRGVLWMGTAAGLAFRGASGFKVPSGVPASLLEPIVGMAEDRLGSLWIATTKHVLSVNRTKLADNALSEGDVREHGSADGLRGVEGVKRNRSVVEDSTGRIWLSLNHAIAVLDPARLGINRAPAIANIQGFLVDGKAMTVQDGAHVPGRAQRITFDYVGLGLSAAERVRFRYLLEGFDKNWNEHVGTRQATYTNLPAGRYRFRLAAANPDGVWSEHDATFGFQVDPLFWQTWWFRLGLVACFAFIVAALHHFRVTRVARQLSVRFEERMNERSRIARELHDTLLQSFNGSLLRFQAASNLLPTRPEEAKKKLDLAIDQASQAVAEGRGAVQGLRESTVLGADLAVAIKTLGEGLVASGDQQDTPVFEVAVGGTPRKLRPIVRDELYRIAGEALRNAFRHAQANRIEVELYYDVRHLRLRIRDDGKGIESDLVRKEGRTGHFGLHGMRERAKLIGAKLELWSQISSGTEVELTMPASHAYDISGSHERKIE
jgi:signal transduction histidine kinase/ligand-binding sensor domain-containing protein